MQLLLSIYRGLDPKEKLLVWVAVAALLVLALGGDGMGLVAGAQVVAAVGTLALAGLAYAQVKELRETRIAQERPQVIVDADYSSTDVINVVVRNIGKGAAKDITFEFSALMESPWSVGEDGEPTTLNELPYFEKGIDFLAPGAEISTLWATYIDLFPFLEKRGPTEGITVTSRYKSLTGESHETSWTINPLLLKGTAFTNEKGTKDPVKATEQISKDFHRVVSPIHKELKVSTETECQERRQERQQRREHQEDSGR